MLPLENLYVLKLRLQLIEGSAQAWLFARDEPKIKFELWLDSGSKILSSF